MVAAMMPPRHGANCGSRRDRDDHRDQCSEHNPGQNLIAPITPSGDGRGANRGVQFDFFRGAIDFERDFRADWNLHPETADVVVVLDRGTVDRKHRVVVAQASPVGG